MMKIVYWTLGALGVIVLVSIIDARVSAWAAQFDYGVFEAVRFVAYWPAYALMSGVVGYLLVVFLPVYRGRANAFAAVVFLVLMALFYEKTAEYFTLGSVSLLVFAALSVPGVMIGGKLARWHGGWMRAFGVLAGYAGLVVGVQALKILVGRPRPGDGFEPWYAFEGMRLDSAMQSFPSGHTSFAGLVLGALISLLGVKHPATLTGAAWVVLVGFSSVATGNHYFSDVVFGGVLGAVSVLVGVWMVKEGVMRYGNPHSE